MEEITERGCIELGVEMQTESISDFWQLETWDWLLLQ